MPVTMSGYGQSYMPMGGPAVGAAIYSAQRQQVNFARMVELEKLNLQKRALRQQAAAQVAQLAQREQARQDELSMQQTRFDLEERRLDMQDQERQQRRQDILDAYERAEQQRLEQEEQAIREERNKLTSVGATVWDGQGERPKQHYTLRDGTVYDLTGVDMGRVRGSSPQQAGALNMDAIRKELNMLSAQGARLLRDDETYDQRTHYLYIGADGRVWLVQRTDKNGNPIVQPEEQPKPSPVEGYKDMEEYKKATTQFGRTAVSSHPEMADKMKQVVNALEDTAITKKMIETVMDKEGYTVPKRGEDGNLIITDYRLEALRAMKNAEDVAYGKNDIPDDADRYWGRLYAKAEAMVKLHDAREAMLHQSEDNPDYMKAYRYFKASETKPYEDAGYRGEELQKKLAEAWKKEGLPQYVKDANERYSKALETARSFGWNIPTGRIAGKYIGEWYQRIKD